MRLRPIQFCLRQRLLLVIGTRPEAIKLAPLIHALRSGGEVDVEVCITSQHRELLWPVLEFFRIQPEHDLRIGTSTQTPAEVTCRVTEGIGKLLAARPFNHVIVQGDTSSALGGGLAAFYHRVKLVHVEAGLRSGDIGLPFPEEAHRRLLDVVANVLFVPTAAARRNLLNEGIPHERIHVTGNTGIDALYWARKELTQHPRPLPLELSAGQPLVLLTAHRRESFGQPLAQILSAIREIVQRRPDLRVLFPVHLNPNIRDVVHSMLRGVPGVHLAEPLDYPICVQAMLRADLILTDSGGIQEEATTLGKRLLVLRETTERGEGVARGLAELVGLDADRIVSRALAWLDRPRDRVASMSDCYGDGHACERIHRILARATVSPSVRIAA